MSTPETRFSASARPGLTPFWRRLPRFFLYPFQLGTMLRIGGYSLFSGLILWFLMLQAAPAQLFLGGARAQAGGSEGLGDLPIIQVGVPLMLLQAILWLALLKYAFAVLEHTAAGYLTEPGAQGGPIRPIETGLVFKQFLLYAITGLLIGFAAVPFGLAGVVIGSLLAGLALPAAVMILTVTRSLSEAVNPLRLAGLIRTVGSPYLALWFFLLSLSEGEQWLQGVLLDRLGFALVLPMLNFVAFYFIVIMFHMMGYVLYQYHEALGLRPAIGFDRAEARPGAAGDPLIMRLNALMAEGDAEPALDLLEEALRTRWQDNDLHERYQKLLTATGKKAAALRHGREFITKLVNEKRLGRALSLYEECLGLDPEFQPQDPSQWEPLARTAKLSGRSQLALELLLGFVRGYPGHPRLPAALLLAAQISSENFHRDRDARSLLRKLLEQHPEHELAGEAQQYLAILENAAAGR